MAIPKKMLERKKKRFDIRFACRTISIAFTQEKLRIISHARS